MNILADLKDKNILVTGSNKGIGLAIAQELAEHGAHVLAQYRTNTPELTKLSEKSNVSLIQFDLHDLEKGKELINDFIKTNGPIQGLVNNAGVSKDSLTMRVKPEDIDFIIDTNLKAQMRLTNFLTRNFLRAGKSSVVFIGSVVGLMGNTAQTTYAASKAGLIGYAKSLAKEMSAKQLRANVICPGFIETSMTHELSSEVQEAYLSQIPLSRFGQAQEVAHLTSFLLSESSSYITGEIIKIDGGLYI